MDTRESVKAVIAARRRMEDRIFDAVQEAVSEFRSGTGLSPHSIAIHTITIEHYGDRYPELIVEGITADLRV